MTVIKTLFRFYINSSLHVALAVTCLAIITSLHQELPLNYDLLIFIFFGAVTGYNFIKYAGIAKLHHRSLTRDLRVIQIFSFLSFLVVVWFAFKIKPAVFWVTGFFGFLTVLYALPVLNGKRNLRNIRGLKAHIISLVWTGVSVLCPTIEAGSIMTQNVVLEFFQRYLFILVLLLPFEIRDLKYDQKHLQTIPQRIGVRKAKVMGVILLTITIGLEFLKTTATLNSVGALSCVAAVTGGLTLKAEENQTRFYSSFWIEGIPILWLILLLLAEALI